MSLPPKSVGEGKVGDTEPPDGEPTRGSLGDKAAKSASGLHRVSGRQVLGVGFLATVDAASASSAGGATADGRPVVGGPWQSTVSGSVTAELPRGTTIGRYLITERLGAGGMGVVYAAYDPELDRKVAIKLLHTDSWVSDSTLGRVRLLREAQAMARLSHPNVIAVYDVGTFRDQVFVAMELIDGPTLTDWLAAAPRTRPEILGMFIQAGRGLRAAHAAGLIHRDFKPDKVSAVEKTGQTFRARLSSLP